VQSPYLPGVLPVLGTTGVLAWAGGTAFAAAAGLGGRCGAAGGRDHSCGIVEEDTLAATSSPQVIVTGLGPCLEARFLGAPQFPGLASLFHSQLGFVRAGGAWAPGARCGYGQGGARLPKSLLGPQEPSGRLFAHLDLTLRIGVLELRAWMWEEVGGACGQGAGGPLFSATNPNGCQQEVHT
jgi:hypothetical protein